MKKSIALVLALILVLALMVTAVAAGCKNHHARGNVYTNHGSFHTHYYDGRCPNCGQFVEAGTGVGPGESHSYRTVSKITKPSGVTVITSRCVCGATKTTTLRPGVLPE